MKTIFCFVCLFCAVWSTAGQQRSVCEKWDFLVDEKHKQDQKASSSYFLLHLHDTEKQNDYTVIRKLDSNHQIVFSETAQINLTAINDLWKLSNNILLNDKAYAIFVIKTRANTRAIAGLLRSYQAEIVKQQKGKLIVKTNASIIEKSILNHTDVVYIGKEVITPRQESVVNDLNPTINGINTLKNTFPELVGNNRAIGVKDNQTIPEDIDLIGKNVSSPIVSEIIDDHATDMSTIISGLGNSSATSLGVASESNIFLSDFNEVFPDPQMILDNAEVTIQNHSYGTAIEGFYGELAFEYDNVIAQNPQMLNVFSSGNSGFETSENGNYSGISGFANITGNFKMAKNTLLVGATDELNQVTDFSSKGPAHDGRIKPELVAYSFEGTSNTAALVTGAATLVQEAYENEIGVMPTASLIKALLINAAEDIGVKGPDFSSGYGSLNAKKAVDQVNEGLFFNDVIASDETKTFNITIPENSKNLKITLVWTDPAANVNDNIALVNNLDLKLTSPSNEESLPWILSTEANLTSLQSPATRGIDSLNNIEQVEVETVSAGSYTISITGNALVNDQAFSIAYSWEEANHFSWTYPLENENYPYNGEFIYAVRWAQSFAGNANGSLSVRYNDIGEWQSINGNIRLTDDIYQWNPPEGFSGTAQLRMTVGTSEFLSSSFTITKAFNLRIPLNCETVVELNWPKKEDIDDYRIYNLQGRQLEAVAQVSDTLFTFGKTDYVTPFFAVAPILNDTTEGIRSPTVNYQNFGENCYFNIVSAELTEDQIAVLVTSELSSLSNIESILIISLAADGEERLIETLTNPTSVIIAVQDDNPNLGQNSYQVRINTTAGSTINSNVVTAFYFTEKEPYLLFPNPIVDKGVNVYSNKQEDEVIMFELYDINGKGMLQKELISDREFVKTDGLPSGLFLYRIKSSTNKTVSGKLIIMSSPK